MPGLFIPNLQLAEELMADEGFREQLGRDQGEAIKERASQLSPRGTGRTARSFVVVDEDGEIRVGNTDPFFHLTEWGSVNNPPYAPLRRGVTAAGLRLTES